MRQEETEIVEVLDKCRKKMQEFPQLSNLKPGEIRVSDLEDDIFCYWGIKAYQYVKEIDFFSYKKIICSLSEINGKGCECNYIAYILQKEHGIRMVKLFIEAFKVGKDQQIIPFVEENILFESSVEIEEAEGFFIAVCQNKCRPMEVLLSDYARLVCIMHKQEDVFRLFMKDKKEFYFDFMLYFCREVYQTNLSYGDRMLLELLQMENDEAEGTAVDFLGIGIYYGLHIFEQYFEKIQGWMQKSLELRIKLIPIYIEYLKKAEKEDIIIDIYSELKKISVATIEEKCSFLQAILSEEPLPEHLKQIFDNILLYPFEKNGEMLRLLNRFFSVQKNMDNAEKLQYIYQIYIINEYEGDFQDFFSFFAPILHKMKQKPQIIVDYFMKCMFTSGIENLYFALGLYINAVSLDCLINILQEREISVRELSLMLKGFLYFANDEKNVCRLSYELIRIIPETMDAGPYLEVCMGQVYENYCYTYYELAKQQGNGYGKWGAELTKQILEKYQEYAANQKTAYGIPDLKPSMERELLLRKAKSERNKETNKAARKKSFFASLFSNKGSGVMKYGKRFAAIQYTKKDNYSYLVSPYASFKCEKEIPYIYIKDPVQWFSLCERYLKERDNYCEIDT